MFKRTLSLLLVLCMVFTMAPAVFATDTTTAVDHSSTTYAEGTVAVIGTTEYSSLKEAVNAAAGGDTIKLVANVTLSEKITIKNNVTISGDATITRGIAGTIFAVDKNATLTLDGGIVIDGANDWTFDSENFYADLAAAKTTSTGAKDSYSASAEGGLVSTAQLITISATSGAVVMNKATIQNVWAENHNGASLFSVPAGATLTINDGALISDIRGSVAGQIKGTWIMNGGKITGVHGHNTNGCLTDIRGGTFTIKGGEICNNTLLGLNNNGSGILAQVYGTTSKLIVNGGNIHDNANFCPGGGWGSVVYLNRGGSFEMNGGTIGSGNSDKCTTICCNDPSSIVALNAGTINIAEATAGSYDSLLLGNIIVGKDMTISGGDVRFCGTPDNTLVINGTINSNVLLRAENVTNNGVINGNVIITKDSWVGNDGSVTINGGTWNGEFTVDEGASLSITGGTFKNDVSEYLAPDCKIEKLADGTWTVSEKPTPKVIEVATKAELDAAIAAANEGDTIKLIADIESSAVIVINKPITLELGGFKLTTTNGWGGLQLKNGCSVKNGTLLHTGRVNAIKVWDVVSLEDLVIEVTDTTEGKTVGGIAIQEGAAGVDIIKNVTMKGVGLDYGIETVNCGNAQVIGSMENVNIDAVGTGMLLSAPCGTATNCTIKGGVSGIDMLLKGTYSVSIDLVNCTVEGGEQAVYAHDEQKGYTYVGSMKLTADDTDFVNANGVYLKEAIASTTTADIDDIRNYKVTFISNVKELLAFAAAVNAGNTFKGETVKLTADIDLANSGFTPIGNGSANAFAGTFDGQGHTISNMTLVCDYNRGVGFFRSLAKGAVVKNVTFVNADVNNGAATGKNHFYGVVAGFSTNLTLDNVDVKDSTVTCKYSGAVMVGCLEGATVIKNCDIENVTLNTTSIRGAVYGILGNSKTGHTASLENNTVKDVIFVVDGEVKEIKDTLTYSEVTDSSSEYNKNAVVATIGGVEYVTLYDAVAAAKDGDVITLVKNVVRANTLVIDKNVTLDLNGHTITSTANPAIRIINDLDVTVKKGSMNTDGYCFILGASDGSSAGNLTIENGTYVGNTSVASVTKGTLTINGGEFSVNSADSTYLLNCIDGNYNNGTAKIVVKGGSFKGFNPADNEAEIGDHTNFCAEGYTTANDGNGNYSIITELPEVVVTYIKNTLKDTDPDLTFALNFAIKDIENLDEKYIEDLMADYGSWYTDYVLTISGLSKDSVTFNADGSADGYLAGQYDAFGENWVSVPFENVTMKNGDSLYIMETAAKLLGQSGLRFTLQEVVGIVQNFDCGVYFTPEFLAANPNLEVKLELKIFTEDEAGNITDQISVATNIFKNNIVAIIAGDNKQTQYFTTFADAYKAAQAGDTITLLADVATAGELRIEKSITIDGNGFKIIADPSYSGWYTTNKLGFKSYKKYTVALVADNITLKNLTIDNNNLGKGLDILAYDNIVLDNVTVLNAMGNAININGSEVIFRNRITANTIMGGGDNYTMVAEAGVIFDGNVQFQGTCDYANTELSKAVDKYGNIYFGIEITDANGIRAGYRKNDIRGLTLQDGYTYKLLRDTTLSDNATLAWKDTISSATIDLNGNTLTVASGKIIAVQGNLFVKNEGSIVGNIDIAATDIFVEGSENLPVRKNAGVPADYKLYYRDGKYYIALPTKLPEVVVTDIKNTLKDTDPDLTFALNFAIKDIENLDEKYIEDLMADYGSWYTDYVLTISGLSEDSVTFNADGSADGYLAGQYDAFGENWVSVPFEDVIMKNGESLYIMETAAKLLGQSGLRYTLQEVVGIVQNFDCGVYFTPEFLAANPNLEVKLELKIFTEDEAGNITDQISVATNIFKNNIVAIIAGDNKQTQYFTTLADALAEADGNDIVKVLVNTAESIVMVPAGVTLDLNGKIVKVEYAVVAFGDIIDTATKVGGIKISNDVAAARTSLRPDNDYLPIYDTTDGCYKFFEYSTEHWKVSNTDTSVKLGVRLWFTNSEAYNVIKNSKDVDFDLVMNLTWTGKKVPIIYTIDNSALVTFAGKAAQQMVSVGTVKTGIAITVYGVDKLDEGTVITSSITVDSDTGFNVISSNATYTVPEN